MKKGNNQEFVLSPRSRTRLLPDDFDLLKRYISEIDPEGGFANIKKNCGVGRDTVIRLIERGWGERRTILKIKDFLTALQQTEYFKIQK